LSLGPDLLDRTTAVPLHYQVSRYLRDEIGRGAYRSGDLIPPETVIAADLELSRATVRQGIATLVAEGLLTRRRGVGTVVAARDIEQPLRGLYTMAGLAAESGRKLTTRVLRAETVLASGVAAERLGLRAGRDSVIVLERLRLLDDAPFVLEAATLPLERCQALLEGADLTRPLYELLEQRCSVLITGAREQLQPVNLDRQQARLLAQKAGAAAFHVERTGFAGEEPVEWRVSLVRGDRYLYSVQLLRDAAGTAASSGRAQ
jgi:GntR family transcriptional regulator